MGHKLTGTSIGVEPRVECGKPTAQYVNCERIDCRQRFEWCNECTSADKRQYCDVCELVLV
ncbi:hypothetical protein Q0N40_00785 [Corynebacterium pseudokroppenstedtii]|uniref:Rhodanase C-terminal domain-containing protein n=1 Tax=Corynebacterium pseudokroppenstedtii TaxID=2804917 RepID=A0AAU0Q0X2_9CORY|nr:hypothetical protein [Corynebacterium pseudokroppenstedtii]MCF6793517.1 hypothetical protein [Corynebacterium pseudokroppenstedtii]MCF8702856.1 hypothetical protein [Corynebacterium pseudokroppenstedtii]MCG2636547.1 hypothetical protein [Corynebacterium pseudokroppenstedtii]